MRIAINGKVEHDGDYDDQWCASPPQWRYGIPRTTDAHSADTVGKGKPFFFLTIHPFREHIDRLRNDRIPIICP